MSHPTEQLSAYLDQSLNPRDTDLVKAHLAECAECRHVYAQLIELQKRLKSSPAFTPPEAFYQGIAARMAKADQAFAEGGDRRQGGPAWWGDPYKTFASVGVLVIVGLAVYQKEKPMAPVAEQQTPVLVTAPASVVTNASHTELKKMSSVRAESSDGSKADRLASPPALIASSRMNPIASTGMRYQGDELNDAPVAPPPSSRVSKNVMAAMKANHQESFGASATGGTAAELRSSTVPLMPIQAESAADQEDAVELQSAREQKTVDWNGNISRLTTSETVVVRTSDEWQALWDRHTLGMIPAPPRPAVDFDHQMVVGIFAGNKPGAGYAVTILSVRPSPNGVVVVYQESGPSSQATSSASTQPYDLRVLAKTPGAVIFKKQ